ncbi:MAG: NADPH-dependent FMN reductase [Candidatus Dojkabacteria bacterium]
MKKIITIPGSIRKDSYNKAVCRYLESLSNEELEISSFELNYLPFFNEDLEDNLPKEVKDFVSAVEKADAVIFSTPEYNNMVPGVLKNACEWLTRGYSSYAVKDKPVAIVGASTGGFGTVRAQNQLMLLAQIMGFKVEAGLRLPISNVQDKVDEHGQISDADTQAKLGELVSKLE